MQRMLVLVALWWCSSARLRQPLRVHAGQEDIHNEFPFAVSLQFRRGYGRYCTGSLIAPEWVLTAAHCTDIEDGEEPVVRYANFTLKGRVKVATVLKIILHPGYQRVIGRALHNDIALIKVSRIRDKTIGKLSAIDYKALVGLPVKYAGFGSTTNKYDPDDQFRPLQVGEAMDIPLNLNWYGRISIVPKCSSREQRIQGGDSGGPLIYDGKIIGVASGSVNHPNIAIYTAVSVNLQWIRHQIKG